MSEIKLWTLIRNWAVIAALISTLALTAEPLKTVTPDKSFLGKFASGGATTTTSEKSSQHNDSTEPQKMLNPAPQAGSTTPVAETSAPKTTPHADVTTHIAAKDIPPSEPGVDDEIIALNLEKTSLATIVNFLAERKNINVVPHKDLDNATVSLHNYKPLTLGQAWDILPTLLEINGFTMNKVGKLYRIVSSKESGKEPLAIYSSATGTPPSALAETDQVIRYIYFLRNITAENAQSILSNMFIERSAIDTNRNLGVLFIKEKSINIKAAMQIIEELDQSGLRQSIEIIQLQYESPANIAKLFNDELLSSKHAQNNTIRFITLNKTEESYFSPNVKIMADSPRNALILIGQDRDIKKIKDFINQFLDVKPTAESRIHTRDIKYVPAGNIQQLVSAIIKPPQGISKDELGNNKFFQDVNIVAENPGDASNMYGSGNRIIVTCGNDDWKRIEKLINKLDRPPAQIAIEVMVIDVNNDASRELGTQLRQKMPHSFLGNSLYYGGGMITAAPNPIGDRVSMIDGGLPSGNANTGASIAVGPADNIWAAIRAAISETNTNIIAQPFFIVANRKTCDTSSGQTQRVIGEFQNVQGLRNQEEISAKNTISLTPSINALGIIDLAVTIDFSDFTDAAADPNVGSARTTRNINTRASMAEGEVLVLGGLTSTNQQENLYRWPILSSIPIIGNLFKYKKKNSTKKNLYVFIRPSIIKPEFNGMPDNYTQFKVDYAKRQVFNFQTYGKGIDPIQQFFFKPRKSSISESLEESKSNRFSWIDNFTERRYQPSTVDITRDPYFQQSARLEAQKAKKPSKKKVSVQNA